VHSWPIWTFPRRAENACGGEFGPNVFRQRRDLSRGWPSQGERFRALEREAAATPGTFYFGHLLYEDGTAYPAEIETGLLRGGGTAWGQAP
jgi:hypothetical protein